MLSVTKRISRTKQPKGGYIPVSSFRKEVVSDSAELHEEENIHGILMGLSVGYLTRCMMGTHLAEAFKISIRGAMIIQEKKEYIQELLESIKGLDDDSIVSAIRLSGYDICYRRPLRASTYYRPVREIKPDSNTIKNVKLMVERSISFFEEHGPIVLAGFTFEGGYTNIISSGDGDFITKDTLWDFKVSKSTPNKNHTLQLLIYYIMGMHSIHHDKFKNILNLGIFNPRLNVIYTLPIDKISKEIIDEVQKVVIGYDT